MTRKPSGPLGELLAGLPEVPDGIPRLPVHARVLPLVTPEGADLVFATWRDPGGARVLHEELKIRVEGSLLGELSRTADDLRELPSQLSSLRLFLFCDVEGTAEAVRAFGFAERTCEGARWRTALARLRHEAAEIGEPIDDEPRSVWEAEALSPTPAARAAEEALLGITDDVFGRNPGAPYARLARALEGHVGARIGPDLASLDALEEALCPRGEGALRMIPPLTFQALVDTVAVVASRALGAGVEWAASEPDDDGVAPPPMVRVRVARGHAHVPLGLELLRFSVLPLLPGEVVPKLSTHVKTLFAP